MTNSCWNWSNVPIRAKILGRTNFNGRHDGDCLPCVVRRASIEHADLDESDVPYLMDIFTEFSQLSPTAQVLIADYLRFCENFETLEGADLLLEHTDFSVYVKGMDPQKLVSMYKRHAGEMIESFHKRGSSDTQRLVLPPLT